MHSEGKGVVASHTISHLVDKYALLIYQRTAGRIMTQLGLIWAPMKENNNTFSAYGKVVMMKDLVQLDKCIKDQNIGDNSYVFVCIDESYVKTNHRIKNMYMSKEKTNNQGIKVKSGKGRRLCIIHAITLDGSLCEYEEDGVTPLSDLKWTGNTCHPETRPDGKLTCETLWVAQSHTGDYHNNINSDMFMKWVQEKLCPVFARKYPGRKMILIIYNAPYHHKRVIGSLLSYSKKVD